MPGKIGIIQDNSDHSKFLTKDMNEDQGMQFVINRNDNMHAEGQGFFDDGESLSKLQTGQFEYYKFLHNGKSFIKQNLQDPNYND